jgi:hypothetical protein
MYFAYCTSSGSFRLYRSRSVWRTFSGTGLSPASAWIGSPGSANTIA